MLFNEWFIDLLEMSLLDLHIFELRQAILFYIISGAVSQHNVDVDVDVDVD